MADFVKPPVLTRERIKGLQRMAVAGRCLQVASADVADPRRSRPASLGSPEYAVNSDLPSSPVARIGPAEPCGPPVRCNAHLYRRHIIHRSRLLRDD